MLFKKFSKIAFIFILVLSVNFVAKAQNSASQSVNIQIQSLSDIEFTSTGATEYIFSEVDQLENGIKRYAGDLQVRSNRAWNIQAYVDLSNVAANVDNQIPSNFFQIAIGNPTEVLTFSNLSDLASTVTTGSRGSGSLNKRAISYKINPGYNLNPASYDVTVTYTLSQE